MQRGRGKEGRAGGRLGVLADERIDPRRVKHGISHPLRGPSSGLPLPSESHHSSSSSAAAAAASSCAGNPLGGLRAAALLLSSLRAVRPARQRQITLHSQSPKEPPPLPRAFGILPPPPRASRFFFYFTSSFERHLRFPRRAPLPAAATAALSRPPRRCPRRSPSGASGASGAPPPLRYVGHQTGAQPYALSDPKWRDGDFAFARGRSLYLLSSVSLPPFAPFRRYPPICKLAGVCAKNRDFETPR